jgi:hypothetical protein
MVQQTAVEWLIDEFNQIKSSSTNMNGNIQFLEKEFKELLEQAKQMEWKQLVDAWYNGGTNGMGLFETNTGEQYYQETYGK